MFYRCVDYTLSKTILETHGLGVEFSDSVLCLWVSHPVGVLRQYVSEPGHIGKPLNAAIPV
jgi:endonuclease III-like uncharacterized protein